LRNVEQRQRVTESDRHTSGAFDEHQVMPRRGVDDQVALVA
jgi:hypothetical protein